jgi:hypothetical protein
MDDADRTRRRRVVLVVVALTLAALLVMSVIGALRSGTTNEIGQPKVTSLGLTIC